MKRLVLLLAIGCGEGVSSGNGAGSFDEEVTGFQMTLCKVEAQCFAKDEAECNRDVAEDMAYVKMLYDDELEQRCADCMHVKTLQAQRILDASCDVDAADEQAILDACDLDPNDGMRMDDEACAGYP